MNKDSQPDTEFKLGPFRVTFNQKDKPQYKIIAMSLMIFLCIALALILRYYIIPFLVINGTGSFISKLAIKLGEISHFINK